MILEAGLPLETLRRVVASMAETAREAGVLIVTGDTKVVEGGACAGIYITTAGVGVFPADRAIPPQQPQAGDVILCSSPIASHGMAVMAARHNLRFDPAIMSDVRPLNHAIRAVLDAGVHVRAMRDPTRAAASRARSTNGRGPALDITLVEEALPVRADARAACEILGIDPVYVANEGVALFSLPAGEAQIALSALRTTPVARRPRSSGASLWVRAACSRKRNWHLPARFTAQRRAFCHVFVDFFTHFSFDLRLSITENRFRDLFCRIDFAIVSRPNFFHATDV